MAKMKRAAATLGRGMRDGATGDLRKMQALRREAETTDISQQAWASVGQSMRRAMKMTQTPRTSHR
jgi:hypothetical protein